MGVEQVRFFSQVAEDLGHPVNTGSVLLDFGCGEGESVRAWQEAGVEAFGCDVVLDKPSDTLRMIEAPYRLPFNDHTFDLVVSDQVFEHVQDYRSAFSEIKRVLKPDGISLHLFPARWLFLEPHTFVPLATIIQNYRWCALWALLGVRNGFQQEQGWRERARANAAFLRNKTNYPPNHWLLAESRGWFSDARFVDALAIKYGRRTSRVWPVCRRVPFLADVYGLLRARLLLLGH